MPRFPLWVGQTTAKVEHPFFVPQGYSRSEYGMRPVPEDLHGIQMPLPLRTDSVGLTMSKSFKAMRLKAEGWMRAGISPPRLALTLALGFAIGCIPVLGIPTALCFLVALPLRMNVPAMQAANYAAMPLQVILIFPFARLGSWMFASSPRTGLTADPLIHRSALNLLWASGSLAGQAVAAWLVIAVPMVALMTLFLTAVIRRGPVFVSSQAGD